MCVRPAYLAALRVAAASAPEPAFVAESPILLLYSCYLLIILLLFIFYYLISNLFYYYLFI